MIWWHVNLVQFCPYILNLAIEVHSNMETIKNHTALILIGSVTATTILEESKLIVYNKDTECNTLQN